MKVKTGKFIDKYIPPPLKRVIREALMHTPNCPAADLLSYVPLN